MSQFRRPTYPGDFERARANRLATLVLCGICFLGLLWLAFVCFFNEARAQTVPPALSQGTGSQSGTAVVNAANGTINILSYGAKCDGVATATTDTNGIKSAVAATHGVGKLLIPATGHPCLINSEIDLPDNNTLTVQGPGPSSSTYFLASSIPASSTMLYLGANSHTLLRDLQINCNALGGSVTGVNMQFMTNGEVSNVFTQNCDTGVAVQNSQENFFYNVHANLDGIGLYINASNSSQYLRILSQNSSTYNIQCSGCGASIFEIPLQDEGGATGGINELWHNAQDNTVIYGGTFFADANGGTGLVVDGTATHDTFRGAHQQVYGSNETWQYGFYVDAGTNITFEDWQVDAFSNISGLPDGGFFAPPTGAPWFISSTATVNLRNVHYINGGDAGTETPILQNSTVVNGSVQTTQLPAPSGLALADSTCTGCSLSASTQYCYQMSTLDAQGESTLSSEVCLTTGASGGATHAINLTWLPVSGALQYRVNGRAHNGELKGQLVSEAPAPFWLDCGPTNCGTPSGAVNAINTTGGANIAGPIQAHGVQGNGSGSNYTMAIPQGTTFSYGGQTVGNARVGAGGDTYFDGTNLNVVGVVNGTSGLASNGNTVLGDWACSGYDPITAVATTGSFFQCGATTGASTIRSCTFTPTTTPVGAGTQTIELCNGTGITSSNCTGTKYCTCSLTSSSTALTPVVCTVNTSAVVAGANPTWTITADSLATTAPTGNAEMKATQP